MASRGRATFQKAQKERARKERQQIKAERRELRKAARSDQERNPPQDSPEIAEESTNHVQKRLPGA